MLAQDWMMNSFVPRYHRTLDFKSWQDDLFFLTDCGTQVCLQNTMRRDLI